MATGRGTRTDRVREYYAADPEREWSRFDRHPFEFPVTLSFLERFVEPGSRILDVGGGPGRYALELVAQGHRVTLFDLTPVLLDVARARADEQGVEIDGFIVGDGRDLSQFAEASFDCTLCFGPLYHLHHKDERDEVVREAVRVTRPGGIVALAFISIYGPVYDIVRNAPEKIRDKRESIERLAATGRRVVSRGEPGFTDAAFIDPDAVTGYAESFGLARLAYFGAEGMTAQSEEALKKLDRANLAAWIELAIGTADTPAGIYGSDHLVFIGRKVGEAGPEDDMA